MDQKPISSFASEFYRSEDSSDIEEEGVWNDELNWKSSRPCAVRHRSLMQVSSDEEEGAWNDELDICKPSPSCPVRSSEGARAERARHRMEYATGSQWTVLEEELTGEIERGSGGGMLLERVLAWRKKRGDFQYYNENEEEDDEGNAYLGDVDVPQLPSDMDDVNEAMLCLCFLKSDLQFECLLRNIPYNAADSKRQLISKLMEYKDTYFRRATNTFQFLQEQCNASTSNPSFSMNSDDDEAGKHDGGGFHAWSGGNNEAQTIAMAKCQMDADLREDFRGARMLRMSMMANAMGKDKRHDAELLAERDDDDVWTYDHDDKDNINNDNGDAETSDDDDDDSNVETCDNDDKDTDADIYNNNVNVDEDEDEQGDFPHEELTTTLVDKLGVS